MPSTLSRSDLVAPLRAYGAVILEGYDEPHAEVLALVWGPRFDREHAHTLLERKPGYAPQVVQTVQQAADHFDQLAAAQQRRVRELIMRHHSWWENAPCTASS
jgi:hypothetical protein